jgi:L-asparaginase II
VLAEVIRSGFTESVHRGSLVALDAAGTELMRAGDPAAGVFPRSSNKPMQAAGMLGCGLDLGGKLLALGAASHSGEDFHVAGVREILARAGLTEDALQCPPALPMNERALAARLRAGGEASRVQMNCSGKHAAMLATCVRAGWPTGTYRDPGHPLQVALRETAERLAGEPVAAVGVDGCGAPLFALSLAGLARAFRAIVLAAPGSPERQVADAMRAHPDWTSGSDRPERALMDAVPGLLLKSGAEGVEAFALPDGRAAAYKIEDGSARARPALTAALLLAMGAADDAAGAAGEGAGGAAGPGERAAGRVDLAALERVGTVPVTGGGRVVGEVVVTLPPVSR